MKWNLPLLGLLKLSNQWNVDFSDFNNLVEKLKRVEGGSEKIINKVVHNDGIKNTTEEIQKNIPVSTWENQVRSKKHVKNVKNPQTSKKVNLGFTLKPKPKYDYLKYPDLGIGTSKNNDAQRFMKKGLDNSTPKTLRKLDQEVDQYLNQQLGGS